MAYKLTLMNLPFTSDEFISDEHGRSEFLTNEL